MAQVGSGPAVKWVAISASIHLSPELDQSQHSCLWFSLRFMVYSFDHSPQVTLEPINAPASFMQSLTVAVGQYFSIDQFFPKLKTTTA
jgi:hypothetical protein